MRELYIVALCKNVRKKVELFGFTLFPSLSGGVLSAISAVVFIIGLVLIIKGGDWFVDAASWFAKKTGIPSFVIGATVVSFATTLPELLVSVRAAANGSTEMAIGNAIGSVTCNTTVIMGISLCVVAGLVEKKSFAVKGSAFVASTVLLLVLCLGGSLPVWTAAIFWAILLGFMGYNIYEGKKSSDASDSDENPGGGSVPRNILLFVVGTVGIVLGAEMLVGSGVAIARGLNISESIIGFTVIAFGTSLPEFVTMLTALRKKDSSISVGNIIGANIIDMTLILPLCAVISGKPLAVEHINLVLDFPVAIAASVIAVVPTAIKGKFGKWQGCALVALYAVYLVMLVLKEANITVFGFIY